MIDLILHTPHSLTLSTVRLVDVVVWSTFPVFPVPKTMDGLDANLESHLVEF